jgi:hypothetical protein
MGTDARRIMEGTWQLQEWDVAGSMLRPPQADGASRYDNVVIFAGQWKLAGTHPVMHMVGTRWRRNMVYRVRSRHSR